MVLRRYLSKTKKRLNYAVLKAIVVGRKDPGNIAFGFAIGIFIAFVPQVPYLQTVLALFFAFVFGVNKIAPLIGVWLTNPLTWPFFEVLKYITGRFVLNLLHYSKIHQTGLSVRALEYFVGSIILASLFSVASYFIALEVLRVYNLKLHHRKTGKK